MISIVLIFTVGIIPSLISVWVLRQAQAEANDRWQRAISRASRAWVPDDSPPDLPPEPWQIIGDRTCQFNAHSAYIRCAVNPAGPCQGCPHYEPAALTFPNLNY